MDRNVTDGEMASVKGEGEAREKDAEPGAEIPDGGARRKVVACEDHALIALSLFDREGTVVSADLRKRTQDATIWLPRSKGQGVLVPGGFVLTAAHCIDWDGRGGMTLGDHCLETVQPKTGKKFRMAVYAVEPVADIAVLGRADDQEFTDDAEAFDAFMASTPPVPVSDDDFESDEPVRAHVLSHRGAWLAATVTRLDFDDHPLPAAYFEAAEHVEGGTSGGPVVDDVGRLVGLVSNASGSGLADTADGTLPRPHLALPNWVMRRIREARAHVLPTIEEVEDPDSDDVEIVPLGEDEMKRLREGIERRRGERAAAKKKAAKS